MITGNYWIVVKNVCGRGCDSQANREQKQVPPEEAV